MSDTEFSIRNLALMYNAGRYGDVIKIGEEFVSREPASYACWQMMGAAARQLGSNEDAVQFFQRALALDTNKAEAHNNLGVAFRAKGMLREAIKSYRTAIRIRTDYEETESNLGSALLAIGEKEEAIKLLLSVASRHPASCAAHNNLGIALHQTKKFNDAEQSFRHALSCDPDRPEVLINLGNTLRDVDREQEALEYFEQALLIEPTSADAYFNKAVTLRKLGDSQGAIKCYEEGLKYDTRSAVAYRNLANAKRDLGEFPAAISGYEKSLILNPSQVEVFRNLASLATFNITEGFVDQLLELWLSSQISKGDRCHLGFALYSSLSRQRNYGEAYKYLEAANLLRKEELGYSFEQDKNLFIHLERSADTVSAFKHQVFSLGSITPIFIVGMPRSGTSLLEQILSNHTQISGLGELPFVHRVVANATYTLDSLHDTISCLRAQYSDGIAFRRPNKNWFIDKTPLNFLYLPIIRAAFPEALFIHIYRDPRANCWSNYEQYFVTRGIGFCYSLTDILMFYGSYQSLMRKYSEVMGKQLYHLSYEKLVRDPQVEITKLTDHIGVPFEEQLLEHQSNRGRVATASSEQVRNPIYTDSSERWKKFAPMIGDCWNTLEPFLRE